MRSKEISQTVGRKNGDIGSNDDFKRAFFANYKTVGNDNREDDENEEIPR